VERDKTGAMVGRISYCTVYVHTQTEREIGAVRSGDLEDEVHEQSETVLARVLAGNVAGGKIKEVGAGLGTDGVY